MLYVALGRNVDDKPMNGVEWLKFKNELVATFGNPDTLADGTSHWGGMSEETCVMVWFDIKSITDMEDWVLGGIAEKFGQEAIAWSVAETKFARRIQN